MKIEKLRGRGEKTLKRGHKLILTGNKLPDYDIFAEMERNIYVGMLNYDLKENGLDILAKLTVKEVKTTERGEEIAIVHPFRAKKTYKNTIVINLTYTHHILLIA